MTSLFYDAEFKVLVRLKPTILFTVCKIDLFLLRLFYQITPPCLKGAVSAQKALQVSEMEMRELLGGTEENSVSFVRGH